MGSFVISLILLLPGLRGQDADPIAAIEQRMKQAPLDAFSIARKALDGISGTQEQMAHLFSLGARLQEAQLPQLSVEQVTELASVYAKTLHDGAAADRVRRSWLKSRKEALGAADSPGRVQLARLHVDWFQDRAAAVELCLEAIRLAPDSLDAQTMLAKELGYEKTEAGWRAVPKDETRDVQTVLKLLRTASTPEEIRSIMGAPSRRAQQIVFRRYREQWWYDSPASIRVELDCVKGQSPRVLSVHSLVNTR